MFLLVIISFRFFEARFLSIYIISYFRYFYIIVAILFSVPFVFPKRDGFVLPVQLIVLSIIISILLAYISWEQSLMLSIKATIPYLLWIFFFYLLHIKLPVKTIEKIILIYGVIYILLYFYQFTHSQTMFFGWEDNYDDSRGIVRIVLAGGGIFFLFSFMALNKLTTQKKSRALWLIFSILGIIIPIMQATRQFIVGVLIMYLFHFIKDLKFYKIVIAIVFFIGLLFYISKSNNAIIKGIIEAQKETSQQGNDYIRVLAGTYFITDFSPNNISKVLGNGVPAGLDSYYGQFVADLTQTRKFYLADVGLIAMYAMFGVLAIFAYILIWVRSVTLPLPREYYYLKYYLWFLLVTSLTSLSVYHPHYLISTVFALYIYQTIYEKQLKLSVDTEL